MKSLLLLLMVLSLTACSSKPEGDGVGTDIVALGERAKALEETKPDSALALYARACELFDAGMDSAETRAAARAYLQLGYLQISQQHRYLDAFSNLSTASKIASKNGMHDIAALAENNTAVLYSYYDDVPNTLRHLLDAMRHALQGKDYPAAIMAYENIVVETVLESPPTDSVMAASTRLLGRMPTSATGYKMAAAASGVAKAWMANDTTALLPATQKWIEAAGSGRPDLDCVAAVACQRAGDIPGTLKYLLMACNTDIWNPVRLYAARMLVNTYGDSGLTDSAYVWHRRVQEMEQSLYHDQRYGAVRDMFAKMEARTHSQEVRREKARSQMLATWLWMVVAVALIVSVAAAIIIRQNRELRQRARVLFRKDTQLLAKPKTPKIAQSVDEAAEQQLLERIKAVMADDNLVCQPEFSITTLAHHCGKSVEKVSTAIRRGTNHNFSVMLSEARVRVASLRLRDPAYDNLTIEAVAQSVGMQSRSNFAILFRRSTGVNPGEYRRLARQQKE